MKINRLPLFGGGLVRINKSALIERYNACLIEIGISPTDLTDISIDGIGWSPEVAAEKNDRNYLSFGASNQFGIAISLEQDLQPVYFPSHSFDKALMRTFFRVARNSITDITSQTGIWLDIDDEITEYTGLIDLLMIDHIIIRPNTPGKIMEAAEEQQALVRELVQDEKWTDPAFRALVIESGKRCGDLRFRNVIIKDIVWSDVRKFHTRAFGGTFIFRDLPKRKHLVVLEDYREFEARKGEVSEVYHIDDPKLISILTSEGLIDFDYEWYKKHLEEMKQKCEFLLAEAAFTDNPNSDFEVMTSAQKKLLAVDLLRKGALPRAHREIERFIKFLASNEEPDIEVTSEDPLTEKLLLRPTASLSETERTVVWQLLSRISETDFLRLYEYEKNEFLEVYNTWSTKRQHYVETVIQSQYLNASK